MAQVEGGAFEAGGDLRGGGPFEFAGGASAGLGVMPGDELVTPDALPVPGAG